LGGIQPINGSKYDSGLPTMGVFASLLISNSINSQPLRLNCTLNSSDTIPDSMRRLAEAVQ